MVTTEIVFDPDAVIEEYDAENPDHDVTGISYVISDVMAMGDDVTRAMGSDADVLVTQDVDMYDLTNRRKERPRHKMSAAAARKLKAKEAKMEKPTSRECSSAHA